MRSERPFSLAGSKETGSTLWSPLRACFSAATTGCAFDFAACAGGSACALDAPTLSDNAAAANKTVREVLELTELAALFEHFEDVGSAARSFL